MNKCPQVRLTSNNSSSTRNTNKHPWVSSVSNNGKGKEVAQMNNPNLKNITEWASKAVVLQWADQLKGSSSSTLDENQWATEMVTEVAAQMVHDVWVDLNTYIAGCSVCWATSGYEDWREHKLGKDCPTAPLDDVVTPGWRSLTLGTQGNLPSRQMVSFCWLCVKLAQFLLTRQMLGKFKFAQHFVNTLPSRFYQNFITYLSIYLVFYSLPSQKLTGQSVNPVLGKFNICPAFTQ